LPLAKWLQLWLASRFSVHFSFFVVIKKKSEQRKIISFNYIPIILIMDLKNINLNVKMVLIWIGLL
jgi:hypothetical protein